MLSSQKELFQIPAHIHYLNAAYMSPLLESVEKAGKQGMEMKKVPWTVKPEHFFQESELLRKEYAKIIHAEDPSRIVMIPSVSYGMAVVAKNMPKKPGGKIIVIDEQFPSNFYPWQRIAEDHDMIIQSIQPPHSDRSRGEAWNEEVNRAIDDSTVLVALPHVHWADGTRFDLVGIRQKTQDVGAWLAVDGTQSVGALPFDVSAIQPDALICAGYKWLMGPYSMGLAYFGKSLDHGVPVEENWINRYNSEDFAGLVNYESRYQEGALRYEVGEHSNFILVPMMLEALKQINAWGVENIQSYAHKLLEEWKDAFIEKGYQIEDSAWRGSHMFGLRNETIDPQKLSQTLQDNHIYISIRGKSIRVSLNVWNDRDDLEKLVQCI